MPNTYRSTSVRLAAANPMIATVTKKAALFPNVGVLYGGTEIEVEALPNRKALVTVCSSGKTAVVDSNWLASIAVYRRAKDLGWS